MSAFTAPYWWSIIIHTVCMVKSSSHLHTKHFFPFGFIYLFFLHASPVSKEIHFNLRGSVFANCTLKLGSSHSEQGLLERPTGTWNKKRYGLYNWPFMMSYPSWLDFITCIVKFTSFRFRTTGSRRLPFSLYSWALIFSRSICVVKEKCFPVICRVVHTKDNNFANWSVRKHPNIAIYSIMSLKF